MFVVFDLLAENGGPLVKQPYLGRRSRLEAVERLSRSYRPGERQSPKLKNRDYCRHPLEVGAVRTHVARGRPYFRDAGGVGLSDPCWAAVWRGRWMLPW
jgi:hypothetical protein